MFEFQYKTHMPSPQDALPGRANPISQPGPHVVTGHLVTPPFPEHMERALFGLGCFWGAEKRLWLQDGVYCTAVGYAGGYTPNPTYEEVCSGRTGHAEVVLAVFDPAKIDYQRLLELFWENHDPTQGMRQGVDIGTQYRSVIFTFSEDQQRAAEDSKSHYQQRLESAGIVSTITTEILPAPAFYYAENYHQQYLAKKPGYDGCAIPARKSGRPSYR